MARGRPDVKRKAGARTPRRPQAASGGTREGHGRKSEATREAAILALLRERTISAAAESAGIGERTLRRWLLEDAEFKAEYEAARRSVFDQAMGRVHSLTGKAVDALEELLAATDSPNVRLGAARTVAELGIHQRDAETILRKLDEIEAAQREREHGGRR